ncbi:MAG: nucleotidyltransferase domain-containing protein [Prolixibacteraceae bacterium]|nr:nucleotidyltransferase domain-containing protein [Prolixibacteraceae bacterium]
MHALIENKFEDLKRLCKEYDVKTMHVFGSVCTDKFNEQSDIDILISL